MAKKSYPFSSSMIKSRHLALLNEEDISNASYSDTPEAALLLLKDKGYADGAPELNNMFDFEQVVGFELKKAIEFLKSVCPDESLLNLFLLKYDYLNAKTLIKLNLLGKEFSDDDISKNGTLSFDILKESISINDYSRLPKEMAEAMRDLTAKFAINEDASLIGLVLDKAYSMQVNRMLKNVKNIAIKQYFECYFDFTNMLTVLRLKMAGYSSDVLNDALLEGGKFNKADLIKAFDEVSEADLNPFYKYGYESILKDAASKFKSETGLFFIEKARDDYLIEILKKDRFDMFSDVMSISYLIAKEQEAAAVRLLMVSMLNGIGSDDILKRLKQLY